MLIESSLPTKTVKIGPRDPSYLYPAIKVLVAKRNKLHRNGCSVEADVIAVKINGIISKNHEFCPSKVSESSTKELWEVVGGRKKHNRVVINGVAVNADVLNTYYATVASYPMYSAERVVAYSKNCDISDSYNRCAVYDYQIEPLLRKVRPSVPLLD